MEKRMSELVKVDLDAGVALITVNRPDKLNALNRELLSELSRRIGELASQQPGAAPRCAIVTGAGEKAFVAGADVAELAGLDSTAAKALSELGHRLGRIMEEAPFPLIAAVNGFALGGGCELALACDFIYASDRAKFGMPEVSLGLIPGFGGTQRLPRRIGPGLARELLFTGKTIDAARAQAIGLVNEVFPAAELLQRARETAALIATRAPLAVAAAKRVLRRGADADLEAASELEASVFGALFATADAREGTSAFTAKRPPQFGGR
jgi:enoyl-CoA hydratase